ncbi:hypothetical protein [Bradyrhizobium sp. 164]|uniref:hypothetical protein n=1 Tax=Bradyrhizobium sp. 164 TaxID=2782637 RepID=UPI001FFA9290|nr:hypothetical protein [Bradyrhizobium sp. 164]
MTSESHLREKLRKIEALFAGAGTAGERFAAEAALQRVRARVEELARHDPPIEQQFSLPDQWSRHLFLALCRRYGLRPFRYRRQRRNTVMVRASRGFVDRVLLPEFTELEGALQVYLHEVTLRVIREEIYDDASAVNRRSTGTPYRHPKGALTQFWCSLLIQHLSVWPAANRFCRDRTFDV